MNSKENFMFPKKSDLIKIKISDITFELPDLKNSDESKAIVIGNGLRIGLKQIYLPEKLLFAIFCLQSQNLRTCLESVSELCKMLFDILKI